MSSCITPYFITYFHEHTLILFNVDSEKEEQKKKKI